jgi:ADP-heptose:LPS heptosyltransferase
MEPEPPRPLVMRFSAMGDTVILLTLIRMLYQRFGVPVDLLTSGSWTRPLLEGQPGVGTIHLLSSSNTPHLLDQQKWRLAALLRSRGPQLTWACQHLPKARDLLRSAGIPDTLVVDLNSTSPFGHQHIVDQYACFAKCSPVAFEEFYASRYAVNRVDVLRSPPLIVNSAYRAATEAWLRHLRLADKPLILIQAGNKRTMRWWRPRQRATNTKYWPEAHWASVVRSLRDLEPDAEILLLGVEAEAGINADIIRLSGAARTHNLAGEVPIPRLLGLQERAHGMVSVDTGPAHSAAALDCPLVVLFGVVDPAMYAPRAPSQAVEVLTGTVAGQRSMLGITPAQVISAWDQLRMHRQLRSPPSAATSAGRHRLAC